MCVLCQSFLEAMTLLLRQIMPKTAFLPIFVGIAAADSKNGALSVNQSNLNFQGFFVSKLNSTSEKREEKILPF